MISLYQTGLSLINRIAYHIPIRWICSILSPPIRAYAHKLINPKPYLGERDTKVYITCTEWMLRSSSGERVPQPRADAFDAVSARHSNTERWRALPTAEARLFPAFKLTLRHPLSLSLSPSPLGSTWHDVLQFPPLWAPSHLNAALRLDVDSVVRRIPMSSNPFYYVCIHVGVKHVLFLLIFNPLWCIGSPILLLFIKGWKK